MCSHLREKTFKGRFLKPENLQNHSNEGEGKEEKREKQWLHSKFFLNAALKIVFGRKNCWTQKVHLAVTLSKTRLEDSAKWAALMPKGQI